MKVLMALMLALALPAFAGPGEGEPAPPFSMPGSDGNTYTNEMLSGKPYVIAFFPKAFTGG